MTSSRLVYSTGGDNSCPDCGKTLHKCRCEQAPGKSSSDGVVRLQLERKGRGGKQVTVVTGLDFTTENQKQTLKKLKALCGTGGTAKQQSLEIQGDHRNKLKQHLEAQGYRVKISGA
ncbi:MAG: stress response translation initiation inhibitor YciH [Pseudomonadales bacterium]|nr:stress response translation initiation inhibitor YciH [Pseudomonadales bacterium]